MDDPVDGVSQKSCVGLADSDRLSRLRERLEKSLRDAADMEVELSRADGTIKGVPHYSIIERRAHELGKQLSREVQGRQMRELAASHATAAKCPTCNRRCEVKTGERRLKSIDGETDLLELICHCTGCRRSFFPSA